MKNITPKIHRTEFTAHDQYGNTETIYRDDYEEISIDPVDLAGQPPLNAQFVTLQNAPGREPLPEDLLGLWQFIRKDANGKFILRRYAPIK